jgi:hypothetical protein
VTATVFPGGEGRLRLTEAEEDEEEPGVEVELRPAGKRVQRLSLLSGGEKALGAIAFLFALFLARPCPFYLLDEVEAALDDTNIGRFTGLLRQYADRAQFVVITHQKRTMEAADVLYGVTMGPDGVSQIVSRRLPRKAKLAGRPRLPSCYASRPRSSRLCDRPWDQARVRDGIAATSRRRRAAFDPGRLWPAHEWDGYTRPPLKNLYVGAAA